MSGETVSVHLLRLIADGCSRPSALLRASTGLSTKVMNERLRKMTRFGIVQRSVFGEEPEACLSTQQLNRGLGTPGVRIVVLVLSEVLNALPDTPPRKRVAGMEALAVPAWAVGK